MIGNLEFADNGIPRRGRTTGFAGRVSTQVESWLVKLTSRLLMAGTSRSGGAVMHFAKGFRLGRGHWLHHPHRAPKSEHGRAPREAIAEKLSIPPVPACRARVVPTSAQRRNYALRLTRLIIQEVLMGTEGRL